MLNIEKLKAKGKEIEFAGDKFKIFPLKTSQIAEIGELQAKEKYKEATMYMIRETLNRSLEKEGSEQRLKDEDIDEIDPSKLNKLVPEILKINGLEQPKKKAKTSKQE